MQLAIRELKKLFSTRVTRVSSFIETAAVGGPAGQGAYLNGVVEIQTDLPPYQLLKELQRIESFLGRVRTVQNAPRPIDLDILLYGNFCINEEALCVPHPRMLDRDFVLIPLREIAPQIAETLMKKHPAPKKRQKAGTPARRTVNKNKITTKRIRNKKREKKK